jgi:hypothetical protein
MALVRHAEERLLEETEFEMSAKMCLQCGEEFIPTTDEGDFCSTECGQRFMADSVELGNCVTRRTTGY